MPKAPVAPGQLIGDRYLIGELIGEGGMGVVCEATHIALGVSVAVKLIRPQFRHDHEFVQRFLNEARRAALLKSEHVARVHDVGQLASGEPYLVMERLMGVALDKYLTESGPLAAPDAVGLILQVCDGLAEAHALGVVHRDVKPGNLFLVRLPNGRINVKILDFGISKQICDDAPSSLTNRDRSLGSPWYMSPEQMMDSSSVNHLTDVWSLGVVLFELLTNRRPFEGATVPEVCAKVLTGPTPSLREIQPDIDPELEAVVFRCLAKEPHARYSDVAELAALLLPFGPDPAANGAWQPESRRLPPPRNESESGSIAPLSTTRRLARSERSRRAGWFAVASVALLLLLAFGAMAKSWVDRGAPGSSVLGLPLRAALNPGPEMLPLDRGNGPLDLAAPGPPTVAPADVVPMPPPEPESSARAQAARVPPSDELPSMRWRFERRRVESARRAGENPSPVAQQKSEWAYDGDLRTLLGRARDRYRDSLATEAASAASEPEEEAPATEVDAESGPAGTATPRDASNKAPRDPINPYGI